MQKNAINVSEQMLLRNFNYLVLASSDMFTQLRSDWSGLIERVKL